MSSDSQPTQTSTTPDSSPITENTPSQPQAFDPSFLGNLLMNLTGMLPRRDNTSNPCPRPYSSGRKCRPAKESSLSDPETSDKDNEEDEENPESSSSHDEEETEDNNELEIFLTLAKSHMALCQSFQDMMNSKYDSEKNSD